MDWLSKILNSADDSGSEKTLNQINGEFARIREILQHAVVATPSAERDGLKRIVLQQLAECSHWQCDYGTTSRGDVLGIAVAAPRTILPRSFAL